MDNREALIIRSLYRELEEVSMALKGNLALLEDTPGTGLDVERSKYTLEYYNLVLDKVRWFIVKEGGIEVPTLDREAI